MNYQKIVLVGNATADAESRLSSDGDVAYTTFSIAVGGRKDRTTYFPVVVFGDKLVELTSTYVTKGRQILAEGRVEVRDNNRLNVVADRIRLGAQTGEKPKCTRKA